MNLDAYDYYFLSISAFMAIFTIIVKIYADNQNKNNANSQTEKA